MDCEGARDLDGLFPARTELVRVLRGIDMISSEGIVGCESVRRCEVDGNPNPNLRPGEDPKEEGLDLTKDLGEVMVSGLLNEIKLSLRPQ